MDVHKHSTQIERLEFVETGRRRRWTDDEKLRIVSGELADAAGDLVDSEAPWHFALIADDVAARLPHRARWAPPYSRSGFVRAMVATAETIAAEPCCAERAAAW